MFLPAGWLTPVLPPTDESTVAITVVGTCAARACASRAGCRPRAARKAADAQEHQRDADNAAARRQ